MTTKIYGIDLGTTYSCIAAVDEYGKPAVLTNFEGDRITPSVVYFDDNRRVVGTEAKNLALEYPDSVVEMVKRKMGEADWRFPYQGVDYSPEEISSYILRKVVEDAEKLVGNKITDVVITCPAYFGINEREATAKAGEIAGLNVISIINEPTAAAIAYGVQQDQDMVVLVYDLGGGTFDITMIAIRPGEIEVIATGGDHHLGGRNWDEVVVNYLADQWREKTTSSDDPLDDPETLQDLWDKAEKAKKLLSAPGKDKTEVSVLFGGTREKITLTREKFDELTGNLLAQTIQLTRMMLQTAKEKGYPEFDRMLLVGGSTRMPQVKERLQSEFGFEPQIVDPDEIVAKGAALFGQKLAIGEQLKITLEGWGVDSLQATPVQLEKAQQQVADNLGLSLPGVQKLNLRIGTITSHSFGVEVIEKATGKPIVSNLVLINDKLPVEVTQRFGTLEANQEVAEIRVMENNFFEPKAPTESSKQIGFATLPLHEGLPEGSPIEITFKMDEQGRLYVFGLDLTSKKFIEATIESNSVISADELAQAVVRSKQLSVS